MGAPYELANAIRSLAINAASWTDVSYVNGVLPIACNQVIVYNSSAVAIFLRTDPGNANSQITINPGQAFTIGVSGANRGAYAFLFPQNTQNPPCALLSSSGNVNVTIESLQ